MKEGYVNDFWVNLTYNIVDIIWQLLSLSEISLCIKLDLSIAMQPAVFTDELGFFQIQENELYLPPFELKSSTNWIMPLLLITLL